MKLVLGGGLGGLSAAYYLGRRGAQVSLVEKSPRLGGWVRTEKDSETGIIVETGPHTVRPTGIAGRNTLKLLSELGQNSEDLVIIKRDHPAATKRFICVRSNLHALPSSFSSLFKPSPPFSKPLVFALLKDVFTGKKTTEDETAYDFVQRRFGKELADFAISPMLCGICAGDAKEISIKSLLPVVYEAEKNHGSVLKGFLKGSFNSPKLQTPSEFSDVGTWSVWTHKKGLSFVIDTLRDRIIHQGTSIRLSSVVSDLKFENGRVHCEIEGIKYDFAHLISTIPSYSLSKMLSKNYPELSYLLAQIPFATVIVVNIIFKGHHLKENAFGFLVPPAENQSLLGIIYDSCIYPQGNYTIFTAMLGGRWYNKYFSSSTTDQEIKDLTLDYIKKILNINETPVSCKVSVLENCIPQYTLGHSERVSKIENYIKSNKLPISLVGSSYKGIGVNDVILSAKQAVDNLLQH